ncbi:ABC transporter substrate-binding protein [Cohnella sp. LGH]|uniref:ABC transporter substrate-binding protein n=1 Tax=Cohnella sp. LGH TaxID=1619153 RepID=UPI001ADCEC83|nr:ABC transporter substrate-binding protein [Cohnella sp. LGH]QTH40079.1 ABC transporter substrate-binding protein [Cohnella sp. LGH]
MSQRKRLAALMLMLFTLLLAAACGTRDEGGSSPAATGASQQESGTTASEPQTEEAQSSEQPVKESAMEEPVTRVVSTIKGDVEVPNRPERIVALYMIGDVLSFGITPVGISDVYEGAAFWDQLDGTTTLGEWFKPNQEAIIALDPDLILVPSDETYEALRKIAPTILINTFEQSPEATIAELGEVLGRQEQAAQMIADFQVKMESGRKKLDDAGLLDKTVTLVEGGSKNVMFTVASLDYGRGSQAIYRHLGLKAPELVQRQIDKNTANPDEEGALSLSFEILEDYIGDYVFRSSYKGMADLSGNRLWTGIPAIKEGRLIEIPFGFCYYSDFYSLNKQIDYIVDALIAASK